MTDQPTAPDQNGSSNGSSEGSTGETVIGLATDGAYYLIVAKFPDQQQAEKAYHDLEEIEDSGRFRIDGVVVASCDAEGKVHLGKVTEHSTKTGLKWGVVGGVALGIIFPPSILASAATVGAFGAGIGKVRNVATRSGLAKELEGVMEPNSSGVIALVQDTAVVEIQKALAQAQDIVTKAVDKQVAAEIDREAAAAKDTLAV